MLSTPAVAKLWQELQLTVLPLDRRFSYQSCWPSLTCSSVNGRTFCISAASGKGLNVACARSNRALSSSETLAEFWGAETAAVLAAASAALAAEAAWGVSVVYAVFSPQAVNAAETAKARTIWWSFKRGIGGSFVMHLLCNDLLVATAVFELYKISCF